jgi:SMODS-associated NUDIX domain
MMIRLSAAALCRIVIDERYLLGYNKARLQHGKRVLSPIGGAIEVDSAGRESLEKLGAIFENPSSDDLRLIIAETSLTTFDEWFRSGAHRERTPLRELREELIDEYGLRLAWIEPRLTEPTLNCVYGTTDRPGVAGQPTLRYIEMFDVALGNDWTAGIREACSDERSGLQLRSADEIAGAGDEIADTARLLLEPPLAQRRNQHVPARKPPICAK